MATTITTSEINMNYVPESMLDDDGNVMAKYETEAKEISQGVSAIIADLPPTDKLFFLAMLYDLLEETTEVDSATIILQAEDLEKTAVMISEFFNTAGGSITLTVIVTQLMMLLEWDSIEGRQRSRDTSVQCYLEQARTLRKEGDNIWENALINMVIGLVSAVVSTVMAVISIVQAAKQASAAKEAATQAVALEKHESAPKINTEGKPMNEAELQGRQQEIDGISKQLDNAKHTMVVAERKATAAYSVSETLRAFGQVLNSFIQGIYQKELKELEAKGVTYTALATYFAQEAEMERQIYDNLQKTRDVLLDEFKTLTGIIVELMQVITSKS